MLTKSIGVSDVRPPVALASELELELELELGLEIALVNAAGRIPRGLALMLSVSAIQIDAVE